MRYFSIWKYFLRSHSLSVLGWYIPGLSELPLQNRLPSLLAGPFQLFVAFCISLGTLGPFFVVSSFVSCACVYSEYGIVGETGAVAGVCGCWRVGGGVGRSAVATIVPRCRVCLKTRVMLEWALSGLHLWCLIEYVGVFKGSSGLQDKIQVLLIFATGLKITEGSILSKQQHCRAGERRPR